MSSIWKIGLYKKISSTEAQCLACAAIPPKIILTTGGNTKGLFNHARAHEEYAKKLIELDAKKESEKNALEKFVKILPKG